MADLKTARLEIRMTPAQLDATRVAARRLGVSPSEWARVLLALAAGFADRELHAVNGAHLAGDMARARGRGEGTA